MLDPLAEGTDSKQAGKSMYIEFLASINIGNQICTEKC